MLNRIRDRFGTAGLVVSIMALVLALAGGAFAASGGLNAKQKKQVKAIAKSFQGTGPAGTNGTNGTNGDQGIQGLRGDNGKSVAGAAIAAGGACGAGITGVRYSLDGTDTNVCNGTNGTNGQDAGFNYLFNTDVTNSDPTAGKLKLDNALPGSATTVRISETNNNSVGIAAAIATWVSGPGTKGTLMIRKVGSPGTYAQYTVKTNTDAGVYDNLTVVFVAGNGSFANNDPVTVAYSASGTGTLPSGATETGFFQGITDGGGAFPTYITLPIPLPAPIAGGSNFHLAPNANCPGSSSNPKANPGHACIYEIYNVLSAQLNDPQTFSTGIGITGAYGTLVGGPNDFILGSWAVSAP